MEIILFKKDGMVERGIINHPAVKCIHPVGSRITCNPAPTDTDEDYLVLLQPNDSFYEFCFSCLQEQGYELGGSEISPVEDYDLTKWEGFQSYKKGDINLIVTTNPDFFNKFMDATDLAKNLNLLRKEDRITLFQYVLYGSLE